MLCEHLVSKPMTGPNPLLSFLRSRHPVDDEKGAVFAVVRDVYWRVEEEGLTFHLVVPDLKNYTQPPLFAPSKQRI